MYAKPGDWLVIETSSVERRSIRTYIEEVLSQDGAPPYRVRWTTDDHVSIVFPGPDARVVTDTERAVLDSARAAQFTGGGWSGNSTDSGPR